MEEINSNRSSQEGRGDEETQRHSSRYRQPKRPYSPPLISNPTCKRVKASKDVIPSIPAVRTYKKKQVQRKEIQTKDDRSLLKQEAEEFSRAMVSLLGESLAERLACPQSFSAKPCRCIQRFITNEEYHDGRHFNIDINRAMSLLSLVKKAKELAAEKTNKTSKKMGPGVDCVGLGNKRSERFAAFVLEQRVVLKGRGYSLCERGVQRILNFSNNFLHKSLKTEQGSRRLPRQRGLASLGKLDPVSSLAEKQCCNQRCHIVATTHPWLLEDWRKRASLSQDEARRVLREMLIPVGPYSNCFKFITMVTGVSATTIRKVKLQLWRCDTTSEAEITSQSGSSSVSSRVRTSVDASFNESNSPASARQNCVSELSSKTL